LDVHGGCLLAASAGCAGDDDDGAPTAGLAGQELRIYLGVDGTEHAFPVDLSHAIVAAQYPRPDGGWDIYPGYGDGDGQIEVADAPEGMHWLRMERPSADPELPPVDEYVWTDSADIDYSTTRIGRPDLDYPQASTPVVIAAGGLEPWATGTDLLGVYNPNVAFVNFIRADGEGVSGFPASGATSLDDTSIDWAAAVVPLTHQASGDRVRFLQERLFSLGNIQYYAPVGSFEAAFDQSSGATTRVEGTFAPGEAIDYRLAWKRSAFEALRTQISPATGASEYHAFAVQASPGLTAADWQWQTLPAELLSVFPDGIQGVDDLDAGTLHGSSPYPRDSVYSFHEVGFAVPVAVDDFPLQLPARIGQFDTRFPADGESVEPLASPVRAPQIAGRDLFAPQSGVGASPELSWQAPDRGPASQYIITIGRALGGFDPELGEAWSKAAVLYVPGDVTSVRLPDELLATGETYAAVIRAVYQPAQVDVRQTPYRRALPYAYADAVTAPFQP
jgi:hypothetical protein